MVVVDQSADFRALCAAEDQLEAMDAKRLASEVGRLVEEPAWLTVEEPAWLAALIRVVDFEPRRLPEGLRNDLSVALLELPAAWDADVVRSDPSRAVQEIRRAQDPVGAGFRARVHDLVEESIRAWRLQGRDPWDRFAEQMAGTRVDHDRVTPAEGRGGPVHISEIVEPRLIPPIGWRAPDAGRPSPGIC